MTAKSDVSKSGWSNRRRRQSIATAPCRDTEADLGPGRVHLGLGFGEGRVGEVAHRPLRSALDEASVKVRPSGSVTVVWRPSIPALAMVRPGDLCDRAEGRLHPNQNFDRGHLVEPMGEETHDVMPRAGSRARSQP